MTPPGVPSEEEELVVARRDSDRAVGTIAG
jgi:hypothetical protein